MGTYLNARKVVELASVYALAVDQNGPNSITSLTTLVRDEAERALEFAQVHKLIEIDRKLTSHYKTTIRGDEFLSVKLRIPFGVLDLWAINRRVSLTAMLTILGIVITTLVAFITK